MKTVEVYNEKKSLVVTFRAEKVEYRFGHFTFSVDDMGWFTTVEENHLCYVSVHSSNSLPVMYGREFIKNEGEVIL